MILQLSKNMIYLNNLIQYFTFNSFMCEIFYISMYDELSVIILTT